MGGSTSRLMACGLLGGGRDELPLCGSFSIPDERELVPTVHMIDLRYAHWS